MTEGILLIRNFLAPFDNESNLYFVRFQMLHAAVYKNYILDADDNNKTPFSVTSSRWVLSKPRKYFWRLCPMGLFEGMWKLTVFTMTWINNWNKSKPPNFLLLQQMQLSFYRPCLIIYVQFVTLSENRKLTCF